MSTIAIISNIQMPAGVISSGGALATVSLIISALIALLVSESKYWNKCTCSTLDICTSPLLLTFAAIVAFKIMLLL
ncbi:MAG: hypothetical protein OIN66_09100 [Candidatus Methanoperedens sp.]|nr:hypothetical protein [Candidatus Methanoperedens sp.]